MPDDLVDLLVAEFPDVTSDDVEEALLEQYLAYETDSGWVDLIALTDGVVLTHILRAEEIESGLVDAECDFALWRLLVELGAPVSGDDDISVAEGERGLALQGSEGWLADFEPEAMIALRMQDGVLHLIEVPEADVSFESPAAVEIAEAFKVAAGSEFRRYLETRERQPSTAAAPLLPVLTNALAGRPDLLRQPVPPLETILALAGLEFDSGEVVLPGAPLGPEPDRLTDDEIVGRVHASLFLHYAELSSALIDGQADEFFDAMTSDAVSEFIADRIELAPPPADVLDAIAALAAGPRQQAIVALLRARALEGQQDSAAGEKLIAEALRLDPELVPALLDAGAYAADRGDVSTADGYLRRAGAPTSNPLRSALAPLLRPPESATGRNQPCPCGSGRKHKACCLRNEIHPLTKRATLVYARLWIWAARAPRRLISEHLLSHMDPEFSDGFVIATDLATFEPEGIDGYLFSRGPFLRPDERALVEQWRDSTLAPYEVAATAPGRNLTLRPLLGGGEPVTVADRLMSTSVRRLDMVVCRLLTDGESPKVFMPPIRLSRNRRQELLAAFAEGDPHDIAEFFGPTPPPIVQTRDGDDLVICTQEYRIPKPLAAQAWQELARRLTYAGSDDLAWLNDESTVLGMVRRKGLLWTLETISVKRMDGLAALVREAAPAAKLVSSSTGTAEEKIASAPAPRQMQAVPDLELQEAVRAYIAEHERKWVDEAIPALGGRTPRECVALGGEALRELRALLDDIESLADESGDRPGMDAHRMRELLGIQPAGRRSH